MRARIAFLLQPPRCSPAAAVRTRRRQRRAPPPAVKGPLRSTLPRTSLALSRCVSSRPRRSRLPRSTRFSPGRLPATKPAIPAGVRLAWRSRAAMPPPLSSTVSTHTAQGQIVYTLTQFPTITSFDSSTREGFADLTPMRSSSRSRSATPPSRARCTRAAPPTSSRRPSWPRSGAAASRCAPRH